MPKDIESLVNFVKAGAERAGYEFIKREELAFIYQYLRQSGAKPRPMSIGESYLFLGSASEQVRVIIHAFGAIPERVESIREWEAQNAKKGVYTAHIFQRDGINFGVRPFSSRHRPEEEGELLALRPLEQEILQSSQVIAYFSQARQALDLYHVSSHEDGFTKAFKVFEMGTSGDYCSLQLDQASGKFKRTKHDDGGIYFPHDAQSMRAVPYPRPEIGISKVMALPSREASSNQGGLSEQIKKTS